MSRVYKGLWRVLLVTEGNEYEYYTEATTYEECEIICAMHGMMGIPFEGKRVIKTLIVGPVIP